MDSERHASGMSAHVLDTAFNYRIVFTARTEDLASGGNIAPRTNAERRIGNNHQPPTFVYVMCAPCAAVYSV